MSVTVEPKGRFNHLNVLVVSEGTANHRYVMSPADDYSGQPQEVIDAHTEFHTTEIISAYVDFLSSQQSQTIGAASPRRVGEFREFMELFTEQEALAIVSATQTNAAIKVWYDKAMGGATFSLDNAQVAVGFSALVAAGLLSQARADEIMGADFDSPPGQ